MKSTRIVLACLTTLAFATTAYANGRDPDGSRMQARPIAMGATAEDRLSPPGDSIDWRYVRLADAADVTFTLAATPSNVTLRFTLTDARGNAVIRESSSRGALTVRRSLDPGLYYLSVSAGAAASYKLTVR